jgi:hypothetical protein
MTPRDLQRLNRMHPVFLAAIEDVMAEMDRAGTPMFVVQGGRTAEEQRDLWLKGRDPEGTVLNAKLIVTNCDGVNEKSNHQAHADGYFYAADLAFIPTAARPDPFDPAWPWDDFGDALETRGMRWGGRFKIVDLDHAEYVPLANPTVQA